MASVSDTCKEGITTLIQMQAMQVQERMRLSAVRRECDDRQLCLQADKQLGLARKEVRTLQDTQIRHGTQRKKQRAKQTAKVRRRDSSSQAAGFKGRDSTLGLFL